MARPAYLKTTGIRPLLFNSSRRCCPDLSIYDFNYQIVQNGETTALDGTSCAAPTLVSAPTHPTPPTLLDKWRVDHRCVRLAARTPAPPGGVRACGEALRKARGST